MKKRKRLGAREALASNVKRLREERELSQERLAELAGFHRTYVSQVERCRINITIDNIERLADFLEVPVESMLALGDERAA